MHRRLLKLLSLKVEQQVKNRDFQEYVKKARSLIGIWKRRYGYSSNDPRYVSATLTHVLEDLLEVRAVEYISLFESRDEETNKYLKASTADPKLIEEDQKRMKEDVEGLLKLLKDTNAK